MARVGGALQGSFFFPSVPPFGILIGPINYNYNTRPFETGKSLGRILYPGQ